MPEAVSKKNPKNNQNLLKGIILIAFVIALIFGMIKISGTVLGGEVKTELLQYGVIEDSVNVDGYLVRREQVINAPADGMLSCIAREGERVVKDAHIATVFIGSVDSEVQAKLARINSQLNAYSSDVQTNFVAADEVQVDKAVSSLVSSIMDAASNDMEKMEKYKDDINSLLISLHPDAENAPVDKKEQLLAEKATLEASLGTAKADIYAPTSGVFSSNIDGLENYFDLQDRSNITPTVLSEAASHLTELPSSMISGQPALKLVDNYEWYFAAAVEESYIQDLEVGDTVELRFPNISDLSLDAAVDAVSEAENGKVTLVIACDKHVPEIYSLRTVNADIVRATYSGLKVSKSALRVQDDGTTGVFVVVDDVAKFRNVEVLHTNENFVVLKEDNSIENGVLLYDEVIIEGAGIEENKIVR